MSDGSCMQKTSPNGEAQLRARILKIELPSSSPSSSLISSSDHNGRSSSNANTSTCSSNAANLDSGVDAKCLRSFHQNKSGVFVQHYDHDTEKVGTPLSTSNTLTTSANSYFGNESGSGSISCGCTEMGSKLNNSFGAFGSAKTGESGVHREEEDHYNYMHLRRVKYDHYAQQCTCIYGPGTKTENSISHGNIFVSGDAVAKNRELLRSHNITHIINCCGYVSGNYFEKEGLKYMTLWLEDSPTEDILTLLYKVFDFINAALGLSQNADNRTSTGESANVLVHCTQGVSRSVSFCVAYVMYITQDFDYERQYRDLKSMRGIANPNIGFVCQLLQWGKRMSNISQSLLSKREHIASKFGSSTNHISENDPKTIPNAGSNSYEALRIMRMAPHSRHDPSNIVAKIVLQKAISTTSTDTEGNSSDSRKLCFDSEILDSRFVFIIQVLDQSKYEQIDEQRCLPQNVQRSQNYVWVGKCSNEISKTCALAAADAFVRYEHYDAHILVSDGLEPSHFLEMLVKNESTVDTGTNSSYDDDYHLMNQTSMSSVRNRTRRPSYRVNSITKCDSDCSGSSSSSATNNDGSINTNTDASASQTLVRTSSEPPPLTPTQSC